MDLWDYLYRIHLMASLRDGFLPYMSMPTRYIFAVALIIKNMEIIITGMDIRAPEGKIGSLTATRANMTIGVNSGTRDIQNARTVSGFFATVNMIKYPIIKRKIRGV